jgi:hypothetical protein
MKPFVGLTSTALWTTLAVSLSGALDCVERGRTNTVHRGDDRTRQPRVSHSTRTERCG